MLQKPSPKIIQFSSVFGCKSHFGAMIPLSEFFWDSMNCLVYLAKRFCISAMQGGAGFLGLEGAFKYPGEAWLCIMLLWLGCAHHSYP